MKTQKLLLLVILVSFLFASSAMALNVTINRDNLSDPGASLARVTLFDSVGRTSISTTQAMELSDGSYSLAIWNRTPTYGDFVIENDQITSVSGALAYDDSNQTISFDTDKLARATIHFSDIDNGLEQVMFNLGGISNVIKGNQTFFLPDGEFGVGFRNAGSPFGKIVIENQTITSLDNYLLLDGNGDISFDFNSLTKINITRGDEILLLSSIGGVGGMGGIGSGNYSIYLTPGIYAVMTRGNYDKYGMITVNNDGSVAVTDLLIMVDSSTNTIAFDVERAPKITFDFGQLSDTGTDRKVYYAAVYELIGGATERTGLFPLNSDFFVHAAGSWDNRLGDFDIDSEGYVTTTGHMKVESEVVDGNRIHTTIGFKLCEMNSVTITPASGLRYWFHNHFSTYLEATTYLPNGTYKLYGDNNAKITFKVDLNGIVVLDNNQNHVSLTYNSSSCAPPDADNDNVIDELDLCPATPEGAIVDGDGCTVVNPTAGAGPDLSIASEEQSITVILGYATDPDGNPLTYRWLEGEVELSQWLDVGVNGEADLNLSLLPPFSVGAHVLTLEVSNGALTASDEMILTVENSAPHSGPAGGGVYEIFSPVILGGQVSDYDGDSLTYEWLEGQEVLFTGSVLTVNGGDPVNLPEYLSDDLDFGNHTLTLRIDDSVNDPISADISVEIVDTTAPTLAPIPSKTILWPPNHKMVAIEIEANASDNSGSATLTARVTSNEPENGLGDGDRSSDWTEPVIDEETGIIYLSLRSERSGNGDGRVYTITITAADEFQNESQTQVEIIVPHDKMKK
ncbi:hypothetical protein QUF75_06960 [Desulfococcaceae bacterium HSG7]|nr:hypothetical protein [Desulfococcaceae bacterium HSG7]